MFVNSNAKRVERRTDVLNAMLVIRITWEKSCDSGSGVEETEDAESLEMEPSGRLIKLVIRRCNKIGLQCTSHLR